MRVSLAAGFVVVMGLLAADVHGAGMATHTMVGYRCAKYFGRVHHSNNSVKFNQAIANNLEAYLGGADFPDFLYAYNKNATLHNAAEAAHWPPFQAAAIRYIRSLPAFHEASWDAETEKLVSVEITPLFSIVTLNHF